MKFSNFNENIFEQVKSDICEAVQQTSTINYWFPWKTRIYAQYIFWFPKKHNQLKGVNLTKLEQKIHMIILFILNKR